MTKKSSTKSVKDTRPMRSFSFPEHGINVQARDLAEANEKMQEILTHRAGNGDKE